MRALATILAVVTPALAFAGWNSVDGNGKVETQTREVRGFSEIKLEAPIDLHVRQGEFSVKVAVDSNLQPLVKTRVVDGKRLEITVDESIRPHERARIDVTVPELRALALYSSGDAELRGMTASSRLAVAIHGSGDVEFDGALDTFEIAIHGSGDVDAKLKRDLKNASISVHGSGDVELEGTRTDRLAVSVNGSGEVDLRELPARDSVISVNGSGVVKTVLDGGEASLAVSGSGEIEWSGQARVRRAVSGSGSIRQVN